MKRHPSISSPREFFRRAFCGKTCRPSRLVLPLALSLSALLPSAFAASVTWDGDGLPTPGDGFLWSNPLNWSGDLVPFFSDDLSFGNPLATVSTIQLSGSRTANSLVFTESYTIGAYGTSNVLMTESQVESRTVRVNATHTANAISPM